LSPDFFNEGSPTWIIKDWRERFHAYLGGIVNGLNGTPLAIGGIEDHVHLLVGLRSSHRVDYFLRDLKADSSLWVHREIRERMFAWQRGYAAISVSPSDLQDVKKYVLTQEDHHRRKTFKEELVEILKEKGIEYDERYVW
jgi:REP element-mobilizing transposase RayT